ncbi:hypothetical protein P7K49_021178 [Saguinus oedipus]|uniref:Uncharacterized protein n=1 Tax=Saguinus oedipus TaxID=9490 RepID=A0ABQ9URX1_SAGOE|nr:hypothetical protein P7K49_021178 [Saguinus oedipus]
MLAQEVCKQFWKLSDGFHITVSEIEFITFPSRRALSLPVSPVSIVTAKLLKPETRGRPDSSLCITDLMRSVIESGGFNLVSFPRTRALLLGSVITVSAYPRGHGSHLASTLQPSKSP